MNHLWNLRDLESVDHPLAREMIEAMQNPEHPFTQHAIESLQRGCPALGTWMCEHGVPIANVGIIPVTDPKMIAEIERYRHYASN